MAGKVKDYTGQEVNGRRIIKLAHQDARGAAHWKWECISCGIDGISRMNSIVRHKTPICCRQWKGENNPTWNGYKELSGKKFVGMIHGAKARNHEWNLSKEFLWNLYIAQDRKCAYTGRDLPDINRASLDRTNNSIGYTEDNVKWVHIDVNMCKQRLSRADFIQLCREVSSSTKE